MSESFEIVFLVHCFCIVEREVLLAHVFVCPYLIIVVMVGSSNLNYHKLLMMSMKKDDVDDYYSNNNMNDER